MLLVRCADATVLGPSSIRANSASVGGFTSSPRRFLFTMTDVEKIIVVAGATMALGVTVGGLIFSVRFLWRFFQNLLGGSTWRE